MQSCLVALALALPAQIKETEEGPIAKEKWKSDYTEKTWGLKFKTVKYPSDQSEIRVVFEFTKNLQPDEVKALKAAFERKEGALEFCFFDEDGVIFTKATFQNYLVQGDISGMKGDAIRCTLPRIGKSSPLDFLSSPESVKKVSKVELRPPLPK